MSVAATFTVRYWNADTNEMLPEGEDPSGYDTYQIATCTACGTAVSFTQAGTDLIAHCLGPHRWRFTYGDPTIQSRGNEWIQIQ